MKREHLVLPMKRCLALFAGLAVLAGPALSGAQSLSGTPGGISAEVTYIYTVYDEWEGTATLRKATARMRPVFDPAQSYVQAEFDGVTLSGQIFLVNSEGIGTGAIGFSGNVVATSLKNLTGQIAVSGALGTLDTQVADPDGYSLGSLPGAAGVSFRGAGAVTGSFKTATDPDTGEVYLTGAGSLALKFTNAGCDFDILNALGEELGPTSSCKLTLSLPTLKFVVPKVPPPEEEF